MFSRLRARLTYANVVATLALFLALSGGTAVALTGSNTVFSDDITNNQVQSEDVRNDNLSGGGLVSRDVRPNALTGADINESRLGQVPTAANAGNAGRLDGKDSTELLGARAYARMTPGGCFGPPVKFCTFEASKGVSYIAKVGNGVYCVGVDGITPANGVAIVSRRWQGASGELAHWRTNDSCQGSEFEVVTPILGTRSVRNEADNGSTLVSGPGTLQDGDFSIAIP